MRVTRIVLLLLLFVSENSLRADSTHPNIVFIFIDDMGYADPSCFGNPLVQTPNIDRLAEEGIRLTNFYVNSPICSPSRVAVTTGQYPGRWKIHSYLNSRSGNRSRGMNNYLDGSAPTSAKKLQAAGYATAHFGKWHMGGGRDVDDAPLPTEYGFDESWVAFEGLGDRLLINRKNQSTKLGHGKIEFCDKWEKTKKYTDRAIEFIRENKDKPFYVRLFPNDVHDAHVPVPGTEEKWAKVTKNPWEQKFFAVLEEMDRHIGRLVGEIDSLGLAENTLIVFTSDNGPTDWTKYYRDDSGGPPGFTGPFFGRKWSLFEGGIRMPFIARWKGKIPAGAIDETSMMSGIDLSPTFCKIANVDVPAAEKLDGIDCSNVLFGKPAVRPPLFWQYGAPHAVLRAGKPEYQSPSFAVRDGDWKLLVNPNGSDARLFNLASDKGETTSLLNKESGRAHAMRAQLASWAKDVGYKFDAKAKLIPPTPSIAVMFNNQLEQLQNHGVKQEGDSLLFDGQSWLQLPNVRAPKVAGGKWVRISGEIESDSPNGVIIAHGGDRNGYAVYLKDGCLCFATTSKWKRTEVTSETLTDGSHQFEVHWSRTGEMQLKVDGKLAGKSKSPSVLAAEPGDSIQIGCDLTKPVGSYEVDNRFHGTLTDFLLKYER